MFPASVFCFAAGAGIYDDGISRADAYRIWRGSREGAADRVRIPLRHVSLDFGDLFMGTDGENTV